MSRRTLLGLSLGLMAAVLATVGAVLARRRSATSDSSLWAGGGEVDPPSGVDEAPLPLPTQRHGSRADRGLARSVKMDLSRAQAQDLDPVVEFLTFVQEQRGDGSHLLFVRYDDLDVLARQQGEPVAEFVSRLDHLGVVVSHN